MLDRVSVNIILKSVIAALGVAVVIMLAIGAWNSWLRLQAVNRIAAVADASAHMFTALHNLRIDRASGFHDLNAEKPLTQMNPLLKAAREAEMPALKSALSVLEGIDFPDRQSAVPALAQSIKKLTALHEESAPAFLRPKAERRAGLAQEHFNETNALLALLDKTSAQLTRSVKLEDAFIDQVLGLKELAWLVRNAGGDASVMISNILGGQKPPADALLKYTAHVSKLESAWATLQEFAAGLALPASFANAVERAKRDYFAPDYADWKES